MVVESTWRSQAIKNKQQKTVSEPCYGEKQRPLSRGPSSSSTGRSGHLYRKSPCHCLSPRNSPFFSLLSSSLAHRRLHGNLPSCAAPPKVFLLAEGGPHVHKLLDRANQIFTFTQWNFVFLTMSSFFYSIKKIFEHHVQEVKAKFQNQPSATCFLIPRLLTLSLIHNLDFMQLSYRGKVDLPKATGLQEPFWHLDFHRQVIKSRFSLPTSVSSAQKI